MISFDVILPTIGREDLKAAIDSVLHQDYPHFKLWVIGDGVDSKTLCWPLEPGFMVPRHNGVVIGSTLKRHEDYGAWARNEGVRQGRNEWIAYIDDDDVWLPHHLSTFSSLLETDPSATMLRTAGRSFSLRRKSPRSKARVRRLGAVNDSDILTVGMAHTRELFNRTQGWKPCDNHDKLLWQEMLALGGQPLVSSSITFEFER